MQIAKVRQVSRQNEKVLQKYRKEEEHFYMESNSINTTQ